ncbi:MAG: hypothetical protein K2H52_17675 [Lachnospiraceae bacterium]|nr:hypothetical protein [Lachnospiraceae bacterium]MDE6185530.1 hypothetical protein [Lachnospiraceae bacterium]
MRIGNLEDLDRSPKNEHSEKPEIALRPSESERQKQYKKWKNWWYYHKWYVLCGVILFGIAVSVIGNALGLWRKSPDFQIAYIGKTELPQDTVAALEQAFSSIAYDFNEDGEVIVQINQYIDGIQNSDAEIAYFEYASEISLIGDISNCDSYFFLMDDPKQFQQEFQLLASADGSCPDLADYSVEDKIILWSDCPLLSKQELGTYSTIISGESVTGYNQDLLSDFYLGRRCFFTDDITDYAEQCSKLWDDLYNRF